MYQIKKYTNARGGKNGVSTWSNTSILNAIFQGVDYKDTPMYFQSYDKNAETFVPTIYTFLGQEGTALNNPKTSKGNYKSDIIQALQSITVDNENLQAMHKLNLNEYTNDFIRAAIVSGYSEDSIFYFINHPVVKEIIKGRSNKTVIKAPKSTYKTSVTREDGSKVVEEKEYNEKNLLTIIANMNLDYLKKDIEENNFDENDVNHYAIYRFFNILTKKGKTIKSLESLMNVDSKGLGSSLLYSLEKEQALFRLQNNREISNIDKLLGDFAPTFAQLNSELDTDSKDFKEGVRAYNIEMREKGYVQLHNSWFLPTTIPSMASGFALITNNRLWTKNFPYESNTIQNITNIGLKLEVNKGNDKLYRITLAKKQGDSFIGNEIEDDSIGSASPTKDANIKADIIEQLKSYLYSSVRDKMSNVNLIEQLQDIKDIASDNLFLKKLSIEKVDKKNGINLIVFDTDSKDNSIDNNIVNDIIELLTHKDNKVQNFMKELILQQLSFGGLQKAKQFVKHIPPHYLKHLGIYDDVNREFSHIDTERFITQYIQHNPHLVSSKDLWNSFRKGRIKMSRESIILEDINPDPSVINDIRSRFISMQQSNGSYILFKRDATKEDRFIQIPILGRTNIREYDLSKEISESIFPDNNPKEGWYKTDIDVMINLEKDYSNVKSIINSKLTEGINNPDSEEAIIKICK